MNATVSNSTISATDTSVLGWNSGENYNNVERDI